MLKQEEISNPNLACDKINFSLNRGVITSKEYRINYKASILWKLEGIRKDNKALKFKIHFKIESDLVNGELEVTETVEVSRELTKNELQSKDTGKICLLMAADFINQCTRETTSKMGISPVAVPNDVIENMIKSA